MQLGERELAIPRGLAAGIGEGPRGANLFNVALTFIVRSLQSSTGQVVIFMQISVCNCLAPDTPAPIYRLCSN